MNQNHSSQAVTNPVPASRVVAKPVPQAQTENPREFQLGQMRRRFSPKEIRPTGNAEGTTILRFNLTPSDPDFPFEMTALECSLTIPPRYPTSPPTLRVENKDIPRGFAINVENGFDGLVQEKENATLLDLMKSLDKHLEEFLSAQKAETVKIVMNKDTRHLSIPSREVQPTITPPQPESTVTESEQPKVTPSKPSVSFTDAEKSEASKRREVETRQLEARMGRLPLFKKSSDGIAYTIPIEPRKRGELPSSIKSVKAIQLFVPAIYPLEPCRVKLEGVDAPEARSVEKAFAQKVEEAKALNLMGHINYLAQNMHLLAKTVLKMEPKIVPVVQIPPPVVEKPKDVKGKDVAIEESEEKSHIQYIARPPEWTIVNTEDAEYSDSDSMYSYDSGDELESEEGGVEVEHEPETSAPNPERGTAISFPFIELYGIELLEITTLNITVKCSRCKEITEIKGLKTGVSKTETCRKCAAALIICYRRDLVHAHNVRAGFLDLEECVVGDMLPRQVTLHSDFYHNAHLILQTVHLRQHAPHVPPSIQLQVLFQFAVKQRQMSVGNVIPNLPFQFPPSNSSKSPPQLPLITSFPGKRKKPSALFQARLSQKMVSVDIMEKVIAGFALAVARRCMHVISVMMKKKNMLMSGPKE